MKTDWQECSRPGPDDDTAKFCISLNGRGDIAMNYDTWIALGKSWFVVLLYDPATRRIGIKPVRPGTRNAFPMRPVGRKGAKVLRARRLLKQFGIEITQTLRFPRPQLANGIWSLDLASACITAKVTGHWRRKRPGQKPDRKEGLDPNREIQQAEA